MLSNSHLVLFYTRMWGTLDIFQTVTTGMLGNRCTLIRIVPLIHLADLGYSTGL
jgi:hypothetical protein